MYKMVEWTWGQICLATTAATIGAAVLFANSSLILPKRTPFILQRLEKAVLKKLDGSGTLVEARNLWKDNGAVIMVVRRPG